MFAIDAHCGEHRRMRTRCGTLPHQATDRVPDFVPTSADLTRLGRYRSAVSPRIRRGMTWLGTTHNPEVAGSNTAPATSKALVTGPSAWMTSFTGAGEGREASSCSGSSLVATRAPSTRGQVAGTHMAAEFEPQRRYGLRPFALDLHVYTPASHDRRGGDVSAEDIIPAAVAKGLDGIAVTGRASTAGSPGMAGVSASSSASASSPAG